MSIHCQQLHQLGAVGDDDLLFRSRATSRSRPCCDRHLAADLGTKDDGVIKSHLYVTLHALMPAALIETAFLSNPGDYAVALVLGVASEGRANRSPTASTTTRQRIPPRRRAVIGVIGLFDSRPGRPDRGSARARALARVDLVFLADQAHVPYGGRAPRRSPRSRASNLAWLDEHGVDAIVTSLQHSCAIAERYGWPANARRAFDLIDSAATAVERGGWRIGVVATAATVRSGSYGRRMRAAHPQARKCGSLPRRHWYRWSKPEGSTATRRATPSHARRCDCRPVLDAVIFGCTHYPVLERHFRAALGERVELIDPAFVQAAPLAEFLALDETPAGSGTTRYVTSGDPERFRLSVAAIMEEHTPVVIEY